MSPELEPYRSDAHPAVYGTHQRDHPTMGSSGSRPVVKSPSAAFGRLRIDSPRAPKRSLLRGPETGLRETTPLVKRRQEEYISGAPTSSPPLLVWIGPALICALCYALYNIFIKKGSASIHPVLGGVILQFVAALLGSVLLLVLIFKDGGYEEADMPYDRNGIMWAVCAGAAVGAAEILSFVVSGMGVQAMQSIPIIIGGSVLFGTVLGATVLREMLTYQGWVGVFLIAAGIALVGTDPGGAGGVH